MTTMSHLRLLSVFLVTSVILAGCSRQVSPVDQQPVEAVLQESAVEIVIPVEQDGQTALDATRQSAEVAYKEYDFGVMVESINGVKADASHYWALYVNDEYAQAGASQMSVKTGDVVRWSLEEIQGGV